MFARLRFPRTDTAAAEYALARVSARSIEAPSPAAPPRLNTRHFLSVLDIDAGELDECLRLAARLKRHRRSKRPSPADDALKGQHVALLFEKPSLRTRSTFEIGIRELGGHVIEPTPASTCNGRESATDVARNLERWVAGAVYRTFAQSRLQEVVAAAPSLHLINALSDEEHPCQALADCLTLREHLGDLRGRVVAFVGDGNNVATSLTHGAVMLGARVHIASPSGFELPQRVIEQAAVVAQYGGEVRLFSDPRAAVQRASAVYTDTWTSMGQEEQAAVRRSVFEPYQVNAALMAAAAPDALFMHCLPAHRGEEVTDEVIDSPASVVFDQAENRLHVQKALMAMLIR